MTEMVAAPKGSADVMPAESTTSERRRWRRSFSTLWPPLSLTAALLAIWQLVVILEVMPPILLPGPWAVLVDIIDLGRNLLTGGFVLSALRVTATEIVIGFGIASVVGVAFGYIVAESEYGRRAVMPILVGVNSMPKVALAPVFVAWLGFGISSKIAMAAFIAFFPVIVSTAAGFRAVDPNARMLFRANRASRRQTTLHLTIPSATPFIIAGLKTAAVFSVVGAIVGEFLGGGNGLGELVRQASNTLNMSRVFGYIFYLSLLGVALFSLIGALEKRVAFWAESDSDSQNFVA